MSYYPVGLNLNGKKALVVGAGKIAGRKIEALLRAGARVRVVAPSAVRKVQKLSKKDNIIFAERRYRPSDLNGVQLVVAATSDEKINAKVSAGAKKRGILINVVDNSLLSDFISQAVFRRGKAMISVYTEGREPELSRDLKNYLKENWDDFLSYRDRS